MTEEIVLESSELKKVYKRGAEEIIAIGRISLTIAKGEFVSFIGPSGSGKTTLVNILGCLDNPTSGSLKVGGKEVFGPGRRLSEFDLTKVRREHFGYIFQKFYLIPTLTVYENVILPFAFYKNDPDKNEIERILDILGIGTRKEHLPRELSGGEMQRVAIARALVNKPRILFADEPTGNLDSKRADEIKDIFTELNKQGNLTIIMVTHNPALAKASRRVIELRDGQIV